MRISWFAPRNASNTPVAFIASTRAPAAMFPFAEEITNLSDIDDVTNSKFLATKVSIIKSKKKVNTSKDDVVQENLDILTDIDDDEAMAAAANMLMMRLANIPVEEEYRDELLDAAYVDDEEEGFSLDDLDNDDIDSELLATEAEYDGNDYDNDDDELFDDIDEK